MLSDKGGMEIVAMKEKYGGLLRYIFVKEIPEGGKNRYWTEIETIRMNDTIGQQAVLSGGSRGFQMENRDGEHWVVYGKKLK
jgi:hypothetical protein